MSSDRIQRRIDLLLDEADVAVSAGQWVVVAEKARAVLAIDAGHEEAMAFLAMAAANGAGNALEQATTDAPLTDSRPPASPAPGPARRTPDSFAGGRYQVRQFLGEGGRKRVFLAHDERLDRDVAFALIKTEGLDEVGRERVIREAQAMGRLTHAHIVSIFDVGEHEGAPYVVTELMRGGDVEALLEQARGQLPLARSLEIAKDVCRGLAFAHEHKVVHRDLKPGNVWLTADGTAKIGDFGLAVSLDEARLTQHGMMIGTHHYMPPEQALGGEASPRSDLYSLGCMLYELVTGRTPFGGDSPIAVISQHLHTQPVAPSWHTDRCPPSLEDLILRLMQKNPDARPASAQEVLDALERIDPEERGRSHSDSQANPLERLARGVFVGRQRELERLRHAFDEAFAGRGSVVMLVGEPGIGKTRTALELETYARMRGAQVLWGRAYESSGAPPYWPWVQIARAYRSETPDDVRRRHYGPYAVDLQRIFPGLRELFPNLPEPPAETEEAQFQLFDAFSAFARSVAAERPLVFVLDDLHWADDATLALLTHLAREVSRSRILICGTYRDTDLHRRHPLARTLAELGREQLFLRTSLRGLSLAETDEYLRRAANVEPAKEFIARIYEETEGNPFFVSELVNLMVEEDSFSRRSGNIAVPEGVRQALGRRLDRLSEEANKLLTVLAVAGREVEHALVQLLSDHDDATTLGLLEEALRARVLEETAPGRYRFTHALMQETLLDELSAARRVLLHGQIGTAMEGLYGDSPERVSEIAGHFSESAILNQAHAAIAVRYLRMAADHAANTLAYAEAARHYERCLRLMQALPGAPGEDEPTLRFALGVALRNTGDSNRGYDQLARAMTLYRERGDGDGFARAAIEALTFWGDRPRSEREPIALEALALGSDPELRVEVIVRYVQAYFDPAADALADEARGIATERGLSSLLNQLRYREGLRAFLESRYGDALAILGDALAIHGTDALSTVQRETAFGYVTSAQLALGRVDDVLASHRARATQGTVVRSGLPNFVAGSHAALATCHMLRGDLTAAAAELDIAESIGNLAAAAAELDVAEEFAPLRGIAGGRAFLAMIQGDLDVGIRTLTTALAQGGAIQRPLIAGLLARLLLFQRGPEDDEVRAAFDAFRTERATRDAETGGPRLPPLARGAEVTAALGSASEVADALELLRRYDAAVGFALTGEPFHYLRGILALRLDLLEDAESYFQAGLELCERERCPIDAGRCHQGLATVAERRGNSTLAMEHLDAAGELLSRYGAKLYLDQVLAKKQILKA